MYSRCQDMTQVELESALPQTTVMVVSVTGSTTSGQPLTEEDLQECLKVRMCMFFFFGSQEFFFSFYFMYRVLEQGERMICFGNQIIVSMVLFVAACCSCLLSVSFSYCCRVR